jgi:hypothetical protein
MDTAVPNQPIQTSSGGREWLWLFGFLSLAAGPAWLLVMPENLEIEGLVYGFFAIIAIPVVTIVWLVLLRFSKRAFAPESATVKRVIWVIVLSLIALVVMLAHHATRTTAFNANIIVGSLRHWHLFCSIAMGLACVLGALPLLMGRQFKSAVAAHMAIILIAGVGVPTAIAWGAHSRTQAVPNWKQGVVDEAICSQVLSQDRYNCYQKLAFETQDISYCASSWPNMSCTRPFVLAAGDYSSCASSFLYDKNGPGWAPGEVTLAADHDGWLRQRGIGAASAIQIYCAAGLAKQAWRVSCDWLPQAGKDACRAAEVQLACKSFASAQKTACTESLSTPGLFAPEWFSSASSTATQALLGDAGREITVGRLRTLSDSHLQAADNVTQWYRPYPQTYPRESEFVGAHTSVEHWSIWTPITSNLDLNVHADIVAATASEQDTLAFMLYKHGLSKETPISTRSVTVVGVPAKLLVFGDATAYPVGIEYQVLTFKQADYQYVLYLRADRPVNWVPFLEALKFQ